MCPCSRSIPDQHRQSPVHGIDVERGHHLGDLELPFGPDLWFVGDTGIPLDGVAHHHDSIVNNWPSILHAGALWIVASVVNRVFMPRRPS